MLLVNSFGDVKAGFCGGLEESVACGFSVSFWQMAFAPSSPTGQCVWALRRRIFKARAPAGPALQCSGLGEPSAQTAQKPSSTRSW